jgi:hypothetical protein
MTLGSKWLYLKSFDWPIVGVADKGKVPVADNNVWQA